MKPIKISVTQLRQGMWLVEPTTSWINAPFVYGKSGIIKSAEQIKHIIASGYTEAYYDPARSEPLQSDPCSSAAEHNGAGQRRSPRSFAGRVICILTPATTSKT